jgi:UDP-glucose 4-epimerase
VLVVGCGYLGRNMTIGLAKTGPVAVLARRDPPAGVHAVARVHRGDAADPAVLAPALDGVAHVVWCAGGLLPGDAEQAPERDETATLEPLRTLLALLGDRRDVAVTYMSSGGTVYGNPDTVPVPEDAPTRPIGEYGRVRLAAERLLLDAHRDDGVPVRILRCANVYGGDQPADRGQGAVAVFADRVRSGAEVVLLDEGRTVRDFVHVDDVVDATAALLSAGGDPVVNVGSGRGTTIAELLALVERRVGRRARIARRPGRPFDVDRIVLDITRLQQLVDFAPRDLEEGLRTSVPAPSAPGVAS